MSLDEQKLAAQTVKVTIYNQTYTIRAAAGDDYVKQVAELVDARMRAAAEHLHGVDAVKIAVLAALNIADELCRVRQASDARAQAAEPAEPATLQRPSETTVAAESSWSYTDIFEELPSARPALRMSEQ